MAVENAFYRQRAQRRRCPVTPPLSPEEAALRKAQQSLDAARELQSTFPEFAAARAYYAMFYAATALLLDKGLTFKRHSAVIAAFGREFAKHDETWQVHHRSLIAAEGLRLVGDYDLYAQIDPDELDDTLERTEAFLEAARARLHS